MKTYPIPFLLGKCAEALRARPIPGLALVDAAAGELVFDLCGDPELRSELGQWAFREKNGAIETSVAVERVDRFSAGILRTSVRNAGDQARVFTYFQARLDFDEGEEPWRIKVAGGGATFGTYPSPAFDVREYTFSPASRILLGTDADGRSSNKDLPLMMLTYGSGEDAPGFWYGMEWSGEWYMCAHHVRQEKLFRVELGIPVQRMRLEPGEELTFPAVHVGAFKGGSIAGTNALRRYLYLRLHPDYMGERPYPRVSYDHWFGLFNSVDETSLRRQVDRAAEIGVEVWTMDAGWFGDFPQSVGNWNAAAPDKFPNGLEPLAEYVRSKGMGMGLWFECEQAFPNTWAVKEYPELFWESVPEGGPSLLNLTRRDAQDWMIDLISGWIKRLGLRWSRLDYNNGPAAYWHAKDPTSKIQFAYVQGLYRVLDELRNRHPEWMIENCASGGRRIDLGTLARSHTTWFNDYTHTPHPCRWMQLRSQQFLSANSPNSSVAIWQGAGDPASIDLDVLSRATGKLAFDGDIACLSSGAVARCRHWVEQYKKYRYLLVQDFYQLSPIPRTLHDWDVVQFSSYDGSEGLVAAYRVEGDTSWHGSLCAVDSGTMYEITDLASGKVKKINGAILQTRGLRFALPPHSASLVKWRKL